MPTDSTVADLNDLYRQARTARSKLEPDWYYNLAFYGGNQWLSWDGLRLFRPNMPRNRVTLVDNRIQPVVRKEIARMSKNRPVFTVIPNSPDQTDTNAAQLGEQVMRYLWKHLKLHSLRRKALLWSRICGAGFLKCYWDSSIGEPVRILLGPDGKIMTDANGAMVKPDSPDHALIEHMHPGSTSVKTVAQGDIKVEARSPFQMFIDPLADTFDEVEWLIEESVKSTEYVRRRYGVDATADTPANPGLIEARMGAAFVPGGSAYRGVRVREYWCKPNATHPRGRRAAWLLTGGQKQVVARMLEEDDRPFDPMPYVMFSGIPMPGRLWPMSIVDALRGPQTELNKVKSQLAENRNRVGNPTMLASKQAVQDPERFVASVTQPGGVTFYDDVGSPNAKPDYLAAPPMPEYVIEQIPQIIDSFQEISGQHDVTSAQVPPGVTAASAINLLQEADDTMIAPDIADHEEELGKLGQKALKLVANFYTDTRTIQIGGDNGAWLFYDFKGALLRGNTHVEVQAGSSAPSSKAAQQAQMQDTLTFLAQSGNAPHGRQLAQFLRDNDLGAYAKLIEDYTVTETQCNRENVLISQGMDLPINEYDDHEGHLANHEDFERGAHFQNLQPPVRQLHMKHTAAHRQQVQQQQQEQLQNELLLAGKIPPNTSQAALQEEQELSQLQGLQQSNQQQAQQGQQQVVQAQQQQGFSQAQAEQQQRQAEEQHQMRMQQLLEQHQQRMTHQQQSHEARLRAQTNQQRQKEPQNGR